MYLSVLTTAQCLTLARGGVFEHDIKTRDAITNKKDIISSMALCILVTDLVSGVLSNYKIKACLLCYSVTNKKVCIPLSY